MATPTVTRPLAGVDAEDKPSTLLADVLPYVKWLVIAVVLLGIAALIAVGVVTLVERSHRAASRERWDEVYAAQKDAKTPEERIAALESIADKVKGSAAHAYLLSTLGQLYFEQATLPENKPEKRAAALKKATELFEIVATQEPYRSNTAFGPLAVRSLALAQEQAGDYNAAIKTLEDALDRPELETHFLYNKLVGELGRIYYMRSLTKPAGSPEAEKDREQARKRLDEALKAMGVKPDESARGGEQEYASYLNYIRSLVEKPGKLLPDGKAPPVKAPAAPAAKNEAGKVPHSDATSGAKKASSDKSAEKKPAEAKKPAEKAPDAKK